MFERVEFEAFKAGFRRDWKQGQHLLAIGPTGCGKTQLLRQVMPIRRCVVMFGTKTYDDSYRDILKDGFTRIDQWPPMRHQDKVLLWPKKGKTVKETISIQQKTFEGALNEIFNERGWAVVFDELNWMTSELKFEQEVKYYHHQGRSSNLTLVDGFQRPAYVPVVVYGSASHAFLWKTTEKTDLERLRHLGGGHRAAIEENMRTLDDHEFIYVSTRGNTAPVRSKIKL